MLFESLFKAKDKNDSLDIDECIIRDEHLKIHTNFRVTFFDCNDKLTDPIYPVFEQLRFMNERIDVSRTIKKTDKKRTYDEN